MNGHKRMIVADIRDKIDDFADDLQDLAADTDQNEEPYISDSYRDAIKYLACALECLDCVVRIYDVPVEGGGDA